MTSVLRPGRIGPAALRNRVIKTATFEGMSPGGMPGDDLLEHHRRLAAGGVGMTTVAYCAVGPDGRTFADQLVIDERTIPGLRRIVDAVHAEGAAVSLQLGHCGFFSKNAEVSGGRPFGPSRAFNGYGLSVGMPFGRAMTVADMRRVTDEFALAAARAVEVGFDAIELHLGHGYLLSQFLSPATNRRRDEYGGSLEGRLRFPLQVVDAARTAVAGRAAVLAKMNLSDGFAGGLEIDEAVEIAAALAAAGVDALVLSGGFTSRSAFYLLRGGRPLAEMIAVEPSRLQRLAMRVFGPILVRPVPFEEMFFLERARRVRQRVELPLVLLGGIVSAANMERAMDEGFDFVAVGRALIADPDLVARIRAGEPARTRCDACNICIAEADDGGVRCALDGRRAGTDAKLPGRPPRTADPARDGGA